MQSEELLDRIVADDVRGATTNAFSIAINMLEEDQLRDLFPPVVSSEFRQVYLNELGAELNEQFSSKLIKQLKKHELARIALNISKQHYISDAVTRQNIPALRKPSLNKKSTRQFKSFDYETAATNFVGRSAAFETVEKFMNSDESFSWCMMSGPGGMGKSRFAAEVCQKYFAWEAGFYRQSGNAGFAWRNFRPSRDRLIVIDYTKVVGHDTVKAILSDFANDCHEYKGNRLRVILIERRFEENELQGLKRSDADPHVFPPDFTPLAITSLSDNEKWDVIQQVQETQLSHEAKDEILENLAKLDPEGRPLFAFIAGDALSRGESIKDWSVANAMESLFIRWEERIWSRGPMWQHRKISIRNICLLYTSPSPRDRTRSRMPSSA